MVNHVESSNGNVYTSVEFEYPQPLGNFRQREFEKHCDKIREEAEISTTSHEVENKPLSDRPQMPISANEIYADHITINDNSAILKGGPGTEIVVKEGGWLNADSVVVSGDDILVRGEKVEHFNVEFKAKGNIKFESSQVKKIQSHSSFYQLG